MEALRQATIRVVAIIAEGVPERDAKAMIAYARDNNKIIIGPATVGGVQVGGVGVWVWVARRGATAGPVRCVGVSGGRVWVCWCGWRGGCSGWACAVCGCVGRPSG